jgi:uncharacterized DUF497 family protein
VDVEWDEKKRRINLRKHGLDFADALEVFLGPLVSWLDVRFDYGEPRYRGYGILKERVVAVVFLETESGIRMISMRKATRYEETLYFENLQN